MIEQQQRERTTWLVFAHGKANLMDLESCTALAEHFESLAAGTGPIAITGTGRIFSAGVDLKRILDGGADYISAFIPALERMLRAVLICPRPVVAAVNGHAIAGGCVLACATDLTLMADGGGRIGVPELAVGVPFPPTAMAVMCGAVPEHRLRQVILGAGTYLPEAATKVGLADAIVAPEVLESEALARCQQLSEIPAESYAATKRSLNAPLLERAAAGDVEQTISMWCSEPVRAAIAAYVEKTLGKR
jgi:enoyl-CoA hydratase/carnithine racemase